jgi:hypothetical protein
MRRIDVRIEAFDLEWPDDKDQVRDFHADPEGFMRRFLEGQGHRVNRVDFIFRSDPTGGGAPVAGTEAIVVPRRMPDRNYHIVYPDNEASGWICCCA